jgi:hypothetical protein
MSYVRNNINNILFISVISFTEGRWLRDTNDDLAIYKRFIRFLVKDGIIPTHGIVIGLKYDSYTTFDVQVFNTAGLGLVKNGVKHITPNL